MILLFGKLSSGHRTGKGQFSFQSQRKAMTNLDRIVKSRNITWPTKVRIVKAMVFPVGMCRYESWTIKKAWPKEFLLLNCGVGEDS